MYRSKSPTYEIGKSWEENYQNGPIFSGKTPPLPKKRLWKLLGFNLISPLGVAAGPLPNYKWISLYAKLGYGSLVHKTVRTVEHASHPVPNVLIVDVKGKLTLNQKKPVVGHTRLDKSTKTLSITNSFGNPSQKPSE